MKAKTLFKWTSRIVYTVFIIIMLLALYSVLSSRMSGGEPEIFGYQVKSVLSGSMEPSIKTGSIIAIKKTEDPANYEVGDVLTFKSLDDPNTLITHRVVEIKTIDSQIHYVTKGDNNDANDSNPIPSSNVVGKYVGFTVPFVGKAFSFYYTDAGKIVFLILPGIMLMSWAAITAWRAIASIEEKEETKTT
ncbi:signal peptidase I SipW [Bacillus sp. SCS-153A]|uniref:signal peptidase I SipW n=1 Tax=Rossellomorea sedimentorum TaxID=3115294 RepID=UPI003905D936